MLLDMAWAPWSSPHRQQQKSRQWDGGFGISLGVPGSERALPSVRRGLRIGKKRNEKGGAFEVHDPGKIDKLDMAVKRFATNPLKTGMWTRYPSAG
jgi:hypothetical protein